ncbi:MAG TPA: 4-hydroxybenzoate octaprenyltransferase [Steroidobacteraceae bacterium]|jgi:4-hydroxybenzoate polyprenyltransferase
MNAPVQLRPSWRELPVISALRRVGGTLREYALLMRLHRPIGIWLLMWPMLWALWVAGDGRPDARTFIVFMLGTLIMRSAGCVMNDYADRDLDPFVARTRDRPLAARRVTTTEALLLFLLLCLLAVALLFTLNPLAQLYAVVGGALTISYPFLKRFFPVPQFYLGAAFGIAVPMAFAAQNGTVPKLAWVIFCIAVLWAGVYDTEYAMVDREDDKKLGIKSSAILFGDADRVIIGVMQLMVLFALVLVGRDMHYGNWYWGGLGAAGICFAWQQWLIRKRDPEGCFRAFNNNNYFGMLVFIGMLLHYVFAA